MALNGAYLVDLAEQDRFEHAVRRGPARVHPEVPSRWPGPWPPYSFAVLEQS